jgi:hypothetical protein
MTNTGSDIDMDRDATVCVDYCTVSPLFSPPDSCGEPNRYHIIILLPK